jgi:hypothetical protein
LSLFSSTAVNQAQDLSEQSFAESDFCEQERDIAAVAHKIATARDEPVTQRGSPPLGQR